MNKNAQKTRFDEIVEQERKPRNEEAVQEFLPFYDPKWQERLKEEREKGTSWSRYNRHTRPAEQIHFEQSLRPASKPRQPLDFSYPELSPEHIGFRPLNEREDKMLRHKEDEAYKRRQNYYPYGSTDYYAKQREEEYQRAVNEIKALRQLDKPLPEDIKRQVLDKYNEFRKVAAEFYLKYKEANEMASGVVELNYDGNYRNLIRNFSRFAVSSIKIKMGTLFGHIRDRKGRSSTTARYLADFFHRGLNIFSINALNFELKIHEMDNVIKMMHGIIDEYDKLKKVLIKLPGRVQKAVDSFLRNKSNKEILDWMEEYFPDDKEEFIKSSIRELVSNAQSRDLELHLGDLESMKSYKSIHDKASSTTTEKLFDRLHKNVSTEIVDAAKERVSQILLPKIEFLLELLTGGNKEYKTEEEIRLSVNFAELSRYLKKEFQIDLPSIFNFTNTVMDNYWSRNFPEDEVEMIQVQKLKTQSSKEKFYGSFLHTLRSNSEKIISHSYQLESAIGEHLVELLRNWSDIIPAFKLKEISKYDERDLHKVVSDVMKDLVISSIPNFNSERQYYYGPFDPKFPDFRPLGGIVKKIGKFSIGDVTNLVAKLAPSVPKEFWLHLVRNLVKNSSEYGGDLKHFENMAYMSGSVYRIGLDAMVNLLKRAGKFNPDVFTNTFKKSYGEFYKASSNLGSEFKDVSDADKAELISNSIRNINTIEQDTANLVEFLKFKHNEASRLNQKDIVNISKKKNFFTFNKNGIARKLVKIYAAIKSRWGAKAIFDKYADIIDELIKRKFVSKNFKKNMSFIVNFFESGQEINPKSESFSKIFEIISSLETDLATIEMGDALKSLMADFQEKNPRLYDLNVQVSDKLRFRVLEGKDPRKLSIGVETNCCQRIGGMAESAVKDSFINPLAGVLVLEWKNEEGHWVLVAQSYFHYVPRDTGYILDNVEINSTNKYKSGIDLEAAYAYLAQRIKEKDPTISYFVAGKSYSKIDTKDFKSHSLRSDPRSFSAGATKGTGKSGVYSDYDNRNSIDLLEPKKGMSVRISTLFPEDTAKKTAFNMSLRKHIFKSMLAA